MVASAEYPPAELQQRLFPILLRGEESSPLFRQSRRVDPVEAHEILQARIVCRCGALVRRIVPAFLLQWNRQVACPGAMGRRQSGARTLRTPELRPPFA